MAEPRTEYTTGPGDGDTPGGAAARGTPRTPDDERGEPGRLPDNPALPRQAALEIDAIEAEIGRFLSGELSPERFRSFRLANGIYGQRQPGVQMIRVKIPGGDLNGLQLRRLADIAEQFTPAGLTHLTTRQDVQYHYVPLDRVPRLLRLLAEVDLTTREACGNSVRNVTACPDSGFIAGELFDVQPYAMATYAYLVRNPFCQQMARKFKIALSSCPEDCASTAIHDIGLVGRLEGSGDAARLGFKVIVGGGLGTTPFVAQTLEEFVPLSGILPVIRGVLKVFSEHGNRRNKMKARLKFVVHRQGIEEFRRKVASAVAAMTAVERDEAQLLAYVPERYRTLVAAQLVGRVGDVGDPAADDAGKVRAGHADVPGSSPQNDLVRAASLRRVVVTPPAGGVEVVRAGAARQSNEAQGAGRPGAMCAPLSTDAQFDRWRSTSVRAHRDPARAVVTVMLPLGDIEAPRLRRFADLVAQRARDRARIAIDQNFILPDVGVDDLRALYDGLAEAGLAEASAGTALDITSCPGADTCGLGITSSKGLTRAIRSELLPIVDSGGLDLLRGITVKISGCPNSCGQHHVANIGLHGVAKNVGGKQIPSYQLHLGGRIGAGEARIGTALDRIPARRVPAAVAALLALYARERREGERFDAFVERCPRETIGAALAPALKGVATKDAASGGRPDSGPSTTEPDAEAGAGSGAEAGVVSGAEPGAEAGAVSGAEPGAIADLAIDWGQQTPFTTEEIGAGECAGAGLDVAINPFDNFEAEILQAALFMEREQWTDALANLGRSRYTMARILLERLGKNPESDYETACELRAQVIDRGLAGDLWNEFHREADELLRTRRPEPDAVRALHARAHGLLEEARTVLPRLDRKRAAGGAEVPG